MGFGVVLCGSPLSCGGVCGAGRVGLSVRLWRGGGGGEGGGPA